jgi:hypothetical protein
MAGVEWKSIGRGRKNGLARWVPARASSHAKRLLMMRRGEEKKHQNIKNWVACCCTCMGAWVHVQGCVDLLGDGGM